jgi:hypothetical protein
MALIGLTRQCPGRPFPSFPDRIGAMLAVATVVVGNAADERPERHRRPLPPGERKRTGEPGMVSLREDH